MAKPFFQVLRSLPDLDRSAFIAEKVSRSSQLALHHCTGLRKVCIHGLINYKWFVYELAFTGELFDQVLKNFKNLVVYVVECLPRAERCSDGANEHYYSPQCARKMCIRGLIQ